MLAFKKILAPVDLSEASPKIAPYILTMAAKFDAEIHLLFVARILQYFTGFYVPSPSIAEFEKSLLDGAQRRLYEFRDEFFKDWQRTQSIVVLGDISEEILKYIETAGIDLLIMGTHGRKGFDRAVFGSIAERVVKASSVPVLVINPYRAESP
jgi:nucleotide-binding universal stress UspA family protein